MITEQSGETTQIGRYRHFKGGEYFVIGEATHSETGERFIVYRALYGEQGLWVRPYAMFFEMVNHEGQVVSRFAYCDAKACEAET
jgi:hypothetical protein